MKIAALLVLACAAFAQSSQPNIVNAKFETRASSGDLTSDLRASSPTWFGYAIKARPHSGETCCDQCRLEEHSINHGTPVQLEGSSERALLYRVDSGGVGKMEVRQTSCSLDAGGLPFIWLTGVQAAKSISFLRTLIASNTSQHMSNSAVFAISQHDDPIAIAALEELAQPPQPSRVRGEAIFWLAQQAGDRAASFIKNAIESDPDTEVKEKAVFALSQLPKDEGVPKLIEVAQQNRNPEVRKKAFFWLGQSNDPRALAFIEQVLAR